MRLLRMPAGIKAWPLDRNHLLHNSHLGATVRVSTTSTLLPQIDRQSNVVGYRDGLAKMAQKCHAVYVGASDVVF